MRDTCHEWRLRQVAHCVKLALIAFRNGCSFVLCLQVFQVRKKDTGQIYAMKVMRKEKVLEKEHGEYVRAESQILKTVLHPYIVTLRYSFQVTACSLQLPVPGSCAAWTCGGLTRYRSCSFNLKVLTRCLQLQTSSKLYLVLDFINGGHLFFQLYRQVRAPPCPGPLQSPPLHPQDT